MQNKIYKNIIKNLPYGYSCHRKVENTNGDCDYEFVEVNKEYEKYTGLLFNQVVGKLISNVQPEIFGVNFSWSDVFFKVKNGQAIETEVFIKEDNQFYKIIISSEDEYIITHIIKQSKRFCSFTEHQCFVRLNIVPIIIIDQNYNVYRVNELWKDSLGNSYAFDKNKSFMDFVHPDDIHGVVEKLYCVDHLNSFKIECKLICDDGKYKKVEIHAVKRGKYIYMLAIDVTIQKELERRLNNSNENFETFFNAMDDMALVGDNDGNVLYANKSIEKNLGYSMQELKKMHILDLHPVEVRQEAVGILEDMFNNKTQLCPLPLMRKDGNLIPVETRAWFGQWDNKDCIFSMSKNMTYEQESLQMLLRVFKEIPAVISIIDLNSKKFIDVNKSFTQTLGYEDDEIIGRTPLDLGLIPNEKDYYTIFDDLNNNGHISKKLLFVKAKNGDIINVMYSGTIIKSQNKKYLMIFMTDMTKQIQYENMLIYKGNLQNILVKLSSNYINISLNKINESINKSLEEIGKFVGADRAYIFDYDYIKNTTSNIFEWCNDFITPEIDNLKDVPMESVPEWVESHHKGIMIYIPDVNNIDDSQGELKNILMAQNIKSLITIPMMENEKCIGYVGFDSVSSHRVYEQDEIELLFVYAQILVNLSSRKNQEVALYESNIKAINASKVKSNFIARISHEIRTPLNGALGFLELLFESATMTRQINYINKAKISLNILVKLVDDIRDISKIEENRIEIRKEIVDIRKVIDNAIIPLMFEINKNEINLNVNVGADIPTDIDLIGDSNRIKEIIYNIVSNSIKHTHKGLISIDCSLQTKTDHNIELKFFIKDTGEGISNQDLPNIFEKFYQGKNSKLKSVNGMGLGLVICKELITKMGGRIWAESQIGKGTTIYFTMKLGICSKEIILFNPISESNDKNLQGIRALIAEDNEINRDMAKEILNNRGIIVDAVENGADVIEILKNNDYDLILMDIQMPVMDGMEAAKILRKNKKNEDIPIIAMTAAVMLDERDKILSSGFNSIVEKPLHMRALMDEIYKWTLGRNLKQEIDTSYYDGLLVNETFDKKPTDIQLEENMMIMLKIDNLLFLKELKNYLEENNLDALEFIKVAEQKNLFSKYKEQIKLIKDHMYNYDFQNAIEEINKMFLFQEFKQ